MASSIRVRATAKDDITEVQVLIQHPMDSGFVKDAKGEIIPPHFIQQLTFEYDGKVVFADLMRFVAPDPKALNVARGLVTAAYQDQLEKDWIKELRAKYPVKVEQDVLYSIK